MGAVLSPPLADRALTPATRLRLGGPLPHQLPDGTQARPLVTEVFRCSTEVKQPHAVLARISPGCPPPVGRLLTRYSAVCHSRTPPKRGLLVRLACIRRAASVRPEPGSNSQLSFEPQETRILELNRRFPSTIHL